MIGSELGNCGLRPVGGKRRRRRVTPHLEPMEGRLCLSGLTPGLGVATPVNGSLMFVIDSDANGSSDISRPYGSDTDIPIFGDFTGSTLTNIGIYRPSTGTWAIDTKNNGSVGLVVSFGGPNWKPVTGDINGDGRTDLGLYDPNTGTWAFCTDLSGRVNLSFHYGGSRGDVPLLADFNHDGFDDPVIYNGGNWLVDTNSDRVPDQTYRFGGASLAPAGATPLAFDLYGTHDPVLALVAPQSNGQLNWYINPSRDGKNYQTYRLGLNGSTPYTGYFSTANSLFVNSATGADVAGAGSYGAPFKTITAAVNAATPGTTIRLASGGYSENVILNAKSNLKIVGTGMYSTVVSPASKDAFLVYMSSNIHFDDLWLRSAGTDGRGIVALGSSVVTNLIRTNDTRWIGLLAGGANGQVTTVTSRYSRFDGIQTISGVYLDDAAIGSFYGISASEIGFATDYTGDGAGLVVQGTSVARVDRSTFYHNRDCGVTANTGGRLEMSNSYSGNHIQGFGASLFNNSTGIFNNDTFANNGVTFGAVGGMNGIEFAYNFTGWGFVANSRFLNNTANGVFIESAPNQIQIVNNYFSGNWAGVTVFADQPQDINVLVKGNTFATPADATYETFGVTAIGSKAHMVLGGSGADQNTFDGFWDYRFVGLNHVGGLQNKELGCPDITVLGNVFRRKGQTISTSLAVAPC
ncbi:right-handed parallel beta-helix repeat-containing protein [Paludisphaera rhizosphaerae]|uniref:right-handed parallel beta-helix repeat-containing protein n=1 Tax=Paludisphaera rhizosphaerae TaxID=2711216 RepID=UPI0013ED597F|nr:right-handed parallel beta-helix repeat-containing protein [Paludisphaera rhizosphaerae]